MADPKKLEVDCPIRLLVSTDNSNIVGIEISLEISGQTQSWRLQLPEENWLKAENLIDKSTDRHPFRIGGTALIPLLKGGLLEFVITGMAEKSAKVKLTGRLLAGEAEFSKQAGDAWFFGPPDQNCTFSISGTKLILNLPAMKQAISLWPGHLDLSLSGFKPYLSFEPKDTSLSINAIKLYNKKDPTAAATLTLDLDLFFRDQKFNQDIGLVIRKTEDRKLLSLTFTQVADESAVFDWELGNDTELKLSFLEHRDQWKIMGAINKDVHLDQVAGAMLKGQSLPPVMFNALKLTNGDITVPPENSPTLTVQGIKANIEVPGHSQLDLINGALHLDHKLLLTSPENGHKPEDLYLDFTLEKDAWVSAATANPFTIRLKEKSRFRVGLHHENPFIAIHRPENQPVAEIYIPGLANDANIDDQKAQRFILDVAGHDVKNRDKPETICRLTRDGLELTAKARPGPVKFSAAGLEPLQNVRLEEGRLTMAGGDYELALKGSGQLAYFTNARGSLEVTGGSAPKGDILTLLSVIFQPHLEGSWEDTSGLLVVENPVAWVTVLWRNQWDIQGSISGSLFLRSPQEFAPGAGEWLSGLFGSLRLVFDQLDLKELAKPKEVFEKIELRLQSDKTISLKLLEVFRLDIHKFWLGYNTIEIAGQMFLEAAGLFHFQGELPSLGIKIENSKPAIHGSLGLSGALTLAGGISGSLALKQEPGGLAGRGSLLIPGFPAVGISCAFGKNDRGRPVCMLFGSVDYPIPYAPGVVFRQLGLGLALNKELAGMTTLREKGPEALASGSGLPIPERPEAWSLTSGGDRVSLVASAYLAPVPQGDGPFPYLGRFILIFEPQEDLTLTLLSKLWLFTSLKDADARFQENATAIGVMVLYPRYGRLEAFIQTRRNARMTAAPDMVVKALEMVEGQAALTASPELCRQQLGPLRLSTKIAGFRLAGVMMALSECTPERLLFLYKISLQGELSQSKAIQAGGGALTARAFISLEVRFGYEAELRGLLYRDRFLFYGRTRIYAGVALQVALELEVKVELLVKIGRIKIRKKISWKEHYGFNLAAAFVAEVEGLVGSQGLALQGSGTLRVEVFGFGFDIQVPLEIGDQNELAEVRKIPGH